MVGTLSDVKEGTLTRFGSSQREGRLNSISRPYPYRNARDPSPQKCRTLAAELNHQNRSLVPFRHDVSKPSDREDWHSPHNHPATFNPSNDLVPQRTRPKSL